MFLLYKRMFARKPLLVGCLFLSLAAGCSAPSSEPAKARNVILFIGDGMGISTVTAARIFDGQSLGLSGEEHSLAFDKFPHVALVKTYETDQQISDSAGTATAMMTGSKTRSGVINIGPEAHRHSCEESLQHWLEPLSIMARGRGMGVGVVTTTRLTHATPAVVYAHTPERDWESDHYLSEADEAAGCLDIATQLVDFDTGGGLDVALGGGRERFFGGVGGMRRNPDDHLPHAWAAAAPNRRYVETAAELATVEPGEQVLGLFAKSHMTYVAERGDDSTEPTLADMTRAAIRQLAANPNGYFLMVEGGRIDHGHHDGKPGYAMLEMQAFSRAVDAALEMVDLDDTLVLVTADHSHTFTMGGYAMRGNPILGLVVKNDMTGEPKSGPELDAEGVPYTVVAYANGPGAVREPPRPEPRTGVDAVYQSLVPVVSIDIDGKLGLHETHGGEDVPLYGTGVGSERVAGVIEQNLIFDIMRDAYGW